MKRLFITSLLLIITTTASQAVIQGANLLPQDPLHRAVIRLSIFFSDGSFNSCTGSWISPRHVLTAAHCVQDAEQDAVDIYWQDETLKSVKIYIHPGYKFDQVHVHDIAIIELVAPVIPWPHILPIAKINDEFDASTDFLQLGFGKKISYTASESYSRELMVTNNSLSTKWDFQYLMKFDSHRLLIAIDQSEGTGVCVGDSGGPLLLKDKIIGVSSGTINSGDEEGRCSGHATYTYVPFYQRWIRQIVQK